MTPINILRNHIFPHHYFLLVCVAVSLMTGVSPLGYKFSGCFRHAPTLSPGCINLFIYSFLAVLGLRFCVRAFSSSSERGPLFIAVRGPLTATASPVAGHRLQTRRLSSCGSRAQPLCGMWDPPKPGLEPMSPALAGRFSTTAPLGKPLKNIF